MENLGINTPVSQMLLVNMMPTLIIITGVGMILLVFMWLRDKANFAKNGKRMTLILVSTLVVSALFHGVSARYDFSSPSNQIPSAQTSIPAKNTPQL